MVVVVLVVVVAVGNSGNDDDGWCFWLRWVAAGVLVGVVVKVESC